MTYNTSGWLLSQTDADGIETAKSYDRPGAWSEEGGGAEPAPGPATNAAGDLICQVDPNDKWVTPGYDYFPGLSRERHYPVRHSPLPIRDTLTTTIPWAGRRKHG